jgi:L-aminopeptidase/D-esterase-like protein
MKGGFGLSTIERSGVVVTAAAVVNAVGDILDETGKIIAGARREDGGWLAETDPYRTMSRKDPVLRTNTTLVAVLTDAALTKVDVHRVAQRAHDGMARSVRPVHTSYDGDATFC